MNDFSIREIPKLIISILIVFVAGAVGTLYTLKEITTWYVYLAKPVWTPPNWIVGPIWSILYVLIGTSLFLILEKRFGKKRCADCHHYIRCTIGDKCSMVVGFLWKSQHLRRIGDGITTLDSYTDQHLCFLSYF